jgi:hypothetical protein
MKWMDSYAMFANPGPSTGGAGRKKRKNVVKCCRRMRAFFQLGGLHHLFEMRPPVKAVSDISGILRFLGSNSLAPSPASGIDVW